MCEYAARSCRSREYLVAAATKTSNLRCATSEKCGDTEWESKRPVSGEKERECSPLTECRDGQYESVQPISFGGTFNSDRECKDCDSSNKALGGGCTTTTSTSTTTTTTTETQTSTTKTATTTTTTTTATETTVTETTVTTSTGTSTTSTTTIKQPPISDLVESKGEQTANGISAADQIAAQIADNGVSVESLLAAGYSQDDIRAAGAGRREIQDAISALTQKGDEIINAVVDETFASVEQGTAVELDFEAMKAKMDDAYIPTFVQIDNVLSVGTTSDGVTVELVTKLLNAGFVADDFESTEVNKKQLLEAQTNASTAVAPGGGGTTVAIVVGVLVVLLVVVAAYFLVMKGSTKDAGPPVSFENPMYDQVHNNGGGGGGTMPTDGAYADASDFVGNNGGAGTSGYMDVGGTGAANFGDNGGAFDGGGTSGYMDVGGAGAGTNEGAYDTTGNGDFDNGFDDGSDDEEV